MKTVTVNLVTLGSFKVKGETSQSEALEETQAKRGNANSNNEIVA